MHLFRTHALGLFYAVDYFFFINWLICLKNRTAAAKVDVVAKKMVGAMEIMKKIMGNSRCARNSRRRLTQKEIMSPISYQ